RHRRIASSTVPRWARSNASPPKMIMRGTTRTVVKSSTLPFSFQSQRRRFIMQPSRRLAGKANDLDVLPGNLYAPLGGQPAERSRAKVHVVTVDAAAVSEQRARCILEMRRRHVRRKGTVGNLGPREGQILDGVERDAALDPRLRQRHGDNLAVALQRLGALVFEQPAQAPDGSAHLGPAKTAPSH